MYTNMMKYIENQRMKDGLPKFQKVEISSVTASNLLKYGGMEDFN